MKELCELDIFIGVSGQSLRTEYDCEVVKNIPLDRLVVGTNCPFHAIRAANFCSQYVKTKFKIENFKNYKPSEDNFVIVNSRNEPCLIV